MESYPTAPGKKFVRYSLFEVPTLFMILCALVALGFSAFGVNHFVWQQRFAATALPARGVVTRVEANHSDGTTGCTPTVRYTPASKWAPVTFRSRMSSEYCTEGQTVLVLYSPQNVLDAELESNVRSPWFALGFTGLGAVCSLLFGSIAWSMVVGYETSDADD